jgi:hypothetical protein
MKKSSSAQPAIFHAASSTPKTKAGSQLPLAKTLTASSSWTSARRWGGSASIKPLPSTSPARSSRSREPKGSRSNFESGRGIRALARRCRAGKDTSTRGGKFLGTTPSRRCCGLAPMHPAHVDHSTKPLTDGPCRLGPSFLRNTFVLQESVFCFRSQSPNPWPEASPPRVAALAR